MPEVPRPDSEVRAGRLSEQVIDEFQDTVAAFNELFAKAQAGEIDRLHFSSEKMDRVIEYMANMGFGPDIPMPEVQRIWRAIREEQRPPFLDELDRMD